jgi:hypothetical protein
MESGFPTMLNHRVITTTSVMNQVAEYVYECLGKSGSWQSGRLRRSLFPIRTQRRTETACSGASSWSSPWIVTRWPVRHLVVAHHVSPCAH